MLGADGLDVFEYGCAARAHQLNGAAIPELAKGDHGFDRIGGFERDVMKHQSRRAGFDRLAHRGTIGEFNGVDAGTVQHQRKEVTDAGLFIDHIAERRAIRSKRRRVGGGLNTVGCGRRSGRCLGHAVLAHSNRGQLKVPRSYSCGKVVNYVFLAECCAPMAT